VQWAGNQPRSPGSLDAQLVEQRLYFEKLSSHLFQNLL
jgi:hypothetical protein